MIAYSTFYWDHPGLCGKMGPILSRKGAVFVAESDTVCGLFTLASQEGFDALNRIKGREDRPYLMLIKNISVLEDFIDCNTYLQIENFAKKVWPGPLTLVLKAKDKIPSFMVSQRRTVAIRIPNHRGLQSLLTHFPVLFSTSANRTNLPPPLSINDVSPDILREGACLIANQGKNSANRASTILDCTESKKIRVIREGSYSIKTLEALYGSLFYSKE